MRIGHGYDAHRLVDGRPLVLGGVNIPWEKGLLGHSDADVVTHAVMDALLGAAGLKDIGMLFPDTDKLYEGASSIKMLETVGKMLEGYRVINIDTTIIAQKPKLAPYIVQMRENMSSALNINVSDVNIKATTEEGMGFTGAQEGVCAHAVCLIESI